MNYFTIALPLSKEPSDYFKRFIEACAPNEITTVIQISNGKLRFLSHTLTEEKGFKRPSASLDISNISAGDNILEQFATRFNIAMSLPAEQCDISIDLIKDEALLPLEAICILYVKLTPKSKEAQKLLDIAFNLTVRDSSL